MYKTIKLTDQQLTFIKFLCANEYNRLYDSINLYNLIMLKDPKIDYVKIGLKYDKQKLKMIKRILNKLQETDKW